MEGEYQKYWEAIYRTKTPEQVSWTQETPKTSLDFIHSFHLPKSASIIDIGGGDSKLVDHLLQEGFTNITVLDICAEALEKSKKRLGEKASRVKWIVSDIADFRPEAKYDVWHDRATFHFLISPDQIRKYIQTAAGSVKGFLTIGTFSESGPEMCSGLPVKRYSEETISSEFKNEFDKIRCITEDHSTPFHTKQNFLFCSFKRHPN